MDHHCPFVSNCIGQRNYPLFFYFVTFLFLNSIMVLVDIIFELARRTKQTELRGEVNIKLAIKQYPVLLAIGIWAIIVAPLLASLLGYHCKISAKNETTNEEMKKLLVHYKTSPYDSGSRAGNFSARALAPTNR